MARPLQKKKNKSSLPRVRQKQKSKRINIKSNPIVAANWDPKLTLSQNYHRLGLSSKLNSHTGGTDIPTNPHSADENKALALAIPSSRAPKTLGTAEVKVTRDARTGAIISVHDDDRNRPNNPLNDPLNHEDGSDGEVVAGGGGGRGIVPELEESARYAKRKRPRQQSWREREWIGRLVGRWGDDWGGMVRDRKLNPLQQSEGDLRRRVEVWRKTGGGGAGVEG